VGESMMIPGERDATTMTHREPGAVGGQFSGADIPSPAPEAWMDERTMFEHAREGGGDVTRSHGKGPQSTPEGNRE
jgi:hypothetical protein